VLLVRAAARGRHVRNAAEVEQVCRERGFEVVDADLLALDEQVALFGSTRYVVGAHGAGLVNLLWRRGAPCSLLELFPPDASPAHYHWLCASFGYGYDALRGTAGSTAEGFDVDPDALARAVDRMAA
jgi:capsular polysaccharide biosynthesis protein